jgi:hypothetical protein
MRRVTMCAAGTAGIVLAGGVVANGQDAGFRPASFDSRWSAVVENAIVENKGGDVADSPVRGDRLAPPRPGARQEIKVIDAQGIDDTVVVYLDREGRLLYRHDPRGAMTIVGKGVILPAVNGARRAPTMQPAPLSRPAPRQKLPLGCEPAFSPVVAPAMADMAGRCISRLGQKLNVARLPAAE